MQLFRVLGLYSWSSEFAYILDTVLWINIVPGIVDQSDTVNDLIQFRGHCDLYFMVQLDHYLVDSHHAVDNNSV